MDNFNFQNGLWMGFLIILLVSADVYAETTSGGDRRFHVGGKLGLNISTHGGPDAHRGTVDSTSKFGFAIGVFATVNLHTLVVIQPEAWYTAKGTDIEVDGEYSGGFNMSYLEFPLMVRGGIPVAGRIKPYVALGPQLSVLLSSEVVEIDGSTSDNKDSVESMDVGVILAAGAMYELPSTSGALFVEARYDWGLLGLDKSDALSLKNRVFSILVGYQY